MLTIGVLAVSMAMPPPLLVAVLPEIVLLVIFSVASPTNSAAPILRCRVVIQRAARYGQRAGAGDRAAKCGAVTPDRGIRDRCSRRAGTLNCAAGCLLAGGDIVLNDAVVERQLPLLRMPPPVTTIWLVVLLDDCRVPLATVRSFSVSSPPEPTRKMRNGGVGEVGHAHDPRTIA